MRSKPYLVLALAAMGIACSGGTTEPSPSLEGNYVSTVFRITPAGQAAIDVQSAGGTLTISITANGQTTGNLLVPASVNGGTVFTASMAGTASKSGNSVSFTQAADTFVRDLTWSLAQNGLSVTSQVVGNTTYTITLSRQ